MVLEERGFLTNATNAFTIRLAPAFVITKSDIDRFVEALAQTLGELTL
jgi:acetylornithine/succinyldiaminopimelate/putrescine aminotransferase